MAGFLDFLRKLPGGEELIKEFNEEVQKFLKVWQEHLETDKRDHQEILKKLDEISKKIEK